MFRFRFNQSLDNVIFPQSLTSLKFGDRFNQSLDNVKFPQSLTSLTFGFHFNQSIRNVNWPNIIEITLNHNYSHMDYFPTIIDKYYIWI